MITDLLQKHGVELASPWHLPELREDQTDDGFPMATQLRKAGRAEAPEERGSRAEDVNRGLVQQNTRPRSSSRDLLLQIKAPLADEVEEGLQQLRGHEERELDEVKHRSRVGRSRAWPSEVGIRRHFHEEKRLH